ncbi:MAG: RNA polymerase sigma factor [Patescibacteria group bacterium]
MPLLDQKVYRDEEVLAESMKNPSLFGVLVDKYQNAFIRAAYRVVNHKQEAEDIVQETFAKIYSNASRFKKQEGSSFKSWAYKILLNTSFIHYKKIKKMRESIIYVDASFYDFVSDNTTTNGHELAVETKAIVAKIMNKMPEHLKRVLKMYYLEDKSQKSIADQEHVSVATVKMRLFRAKKYFKKILEGDNSFCPNS